MSPPAPQRLRQLLIILPFILPVPSSAYRKARPPDVSQFVGYGIVRGCQQRRLPDDHILEQLVLTKTSVAECARHHIGGGIPLLGRLPREVLQPAQVVLI